jgi:hypothetical protein
MKKSVHVGIAPPVPIAWNRLNKDDHPVAELEEADFGVLLEPVGDVRIGPASLLL